MASPMALDKPGFPTKHHLPYQLQLYAFSFLIGASLSEPHSNVENGTVVHVRRTAAKNGNATHYCSLVGWSMYKQTR